uniref:Phospholipase B-like n=1 Tax=Meloidogyne floridensis TaxID=298350 RepID=A0A915P0I5_9BILA
GFTEKANINNWWRWGYSPRAKIFQRDHNKVKDMETLRELMRYNDYKHDEYSKCKCDPPYTADENSPRFEVKICKIEKETGVNIKEIGIVKTEDYDIARFNYFENLEEMGEIKEEEDEIFKLNKDEELLFNQEFYLEYNNNIIEINLKEGKIIQKIFENNFDRPKKYIKFVIIDVPDEDKFTIFDIECTKNYSKNKLKDTSQFWAENIKQLVAIRENKIVCPENKYTINYEKIGVRRLIKKAEVECDDEAIFENNVYKIDVKVIKSSLKFSNCKLNKDDSEKLSEKINKEKEANLKMQKSRRLKGKDSKIKETEEEDFANIKIASLINKNKRKAKVHVQVSEIKEENYANKNSKQIGHDLKSSSSAVNEHPKEEEAMINPETVNEEFNNLHLTEGSNFQQEPSSPKPVDYAWLMNQDVPCHSPGFIDDVSNIGGELDESDNLLNNFDDIF